MLSRGGGLVPSREAGRTGLETMSAADSFEGLCCKRRAEKRGWGWKRRGGVDVLKVGNVTVWKQVGEVVPLEGEEADDSEGRWGS